MLILRIYSRHLCKFAKTEIQLEGGRGVVLAAYCHLAHWLRISRAILLFFFCACVACCGEEFYVSQQRSRAKFEGGSLRTQILALICM